MRHETTPAIRAAQFIAGTVGSLALLTGNVPHFGGHGQEASAAAQSFGGVTVVDTICTPPDNRGLRVKSSAAENVIVIASDAGTDISRVQLGQDDTGHLSVSESQVGEDETVNLRVESGNQVTGTSQAKMDCKPNEEDPDHGPSTSTSTTQPAGSDPGVEQNQPPVADGSAVTTSTSISSPATGISKGSSTLSDQDPVSRRKAAGGESTTAPAATAKKVSKLAMTGFIGGRGF